MRTRFLIRPRGPDQLADGGRLVRVQVVEQRGVAASELGSEPLPHSCFEAGIGNASPHGTQRQRAIGAHGADQRQVDSSVHRARLHAFLAALDLRMRASHRDVYARFIDRNQPPRVDGGDGRAKRVAFGTNVGSVALKATPRRASRFARTSSRDAPPWRRRRAAFRRGRHAPSPGPSPCWARPPSGTRSGSAAVQRLVIRRLRRNRLRKSGTAADSGRNLLRNLRVNLTVPTFYKP